MLGSHMGMWMVPELHPNVQGVRKKFQMTDFAMPINLFFIKHALKSVPGLADVGVLHGDGDGSGTLAPGFGSKIYTHHVVQHEKL